MEEPGFDGIPKKEMTFGQTDNVDAMQQTQQNWVTNKIDANDENLKVTF
jgi:hypothetical protein